jgi:nucleotide-binding universal stress UspA family protein
MFKKIFCPIDGSPTSEYCLTQAIELAQSIKSEVFILHIIDDFVPFLDNLELSNMDEVEQQIRLKGKKLLDTCVKRVEAEGLVAQSKLVEIMSKNIPTVIVEEAQAWGADLIMIGTHGRRGLNHFLMGSNTEVVVRISPIPVLTIRKD